MKLFKITVKSKFKWIKKRKVYYMIRKSKEEAIDYIKSSLHLDYEIASVSYLGYQIGSHVYVNGVCDE